MPSLWLKRLTFSILFVYFCTALSLPCIAEHKADRNIKIGVLSKRGTEIALLRWSATAKYLHTKIPDYQFTIVPINFEDVEPSVKNHSIDFLLTNSGMFVDLTFTYQLSAIATLKRRISNQGYTLFGSTIFTRKERVHIKKLQDLKDQDIAAVNKQSLGGWIAAFRELDDANISLKDFNSLSFLGTHDAVVHAIKNKSFDVGIVRTDTLERMALEGKINLKQFKTIPFIQENVPDHTNINNTSEFPLMHSSRLYPEWPMASMPHISEVLSEEVSSALLVMPSTSDAAKAAKIMGWTVPKNYREVDRAYSQLKLGFYKNLRNYSLIDVINRYWRYFLTACLFLTIMITVTLYIFSLKRKLKDSEIKLRTQATHDSLTGLPNRILFFELANKYLYLARRAKHQSMVLFLDLDELKKINHTYGHDVGDVFLKDTSQRILSCLRDTDIMARIGADEFLIILSHTRTVEAFKAVIQRIIEVAKLPMVSQYGNAVQTGCSIGASHYPEHGEDIKTLIKKSNSALYKAKNNGRNNYIIYTE